MGRLVPLALVILTVVLGWAAIEFVPSTLFFPVVHYSTPEAIRFSVLKTGELTTQRCEQALKDLSRGIRSACPACTLVERCHRGLDEERKAILSGEPLPMPSARNAARTITVTVSAPDSAVGHALCELMAKQSSSQPIAQRLRCYPASTDRAS